MQGERNHSCFNTSDCYIGTVRVCVLLLIQWWMRYRWAKWVYFMVCAPCHQLEVSGLSLIILSSPTSLYFKMSYAILALGCGFLQLRKTWLLCLMSQIAVTINLVTLTITLSQETIPRGVAGNKNGCVMVSLSRIAFCLPLPFYGRRHKGHCIPNICKFMGEEAVGNEIYNQAHCCTRILLVRAHIKTFFSLVPVDADLDPADCSHH